jgi:excisionase family DNA binding protein
MVAIVLLSQENKKSMGEWLTVKQAGELLGLSEWSIRRRIGDGKLTAYRTKPDSGAAYRLRRGDVEAYLERMRVQRPEE